MDRKVDERSLRKTWLKRKFSSWEYHEELLALHQDYLASLHRHWGNPEIQKQYPNDFKSLQSPVFPNFDKVQKPGEITKTEWGSKPTVGWADAISYNFNRGMDFAGCNEYAGMDDTERIRLNSLVGQMLMHCQNIKTMINNGFVSRRTGTDDLILDEEITGPIAWPDNWREDLMGSEGVLLSEHDEPRVKGGEPAPQGGLWKAVDVSGQQRRVQTGELLPDLGSAYGTTIWRRIGD